VLHDALYKASPAVPPPVEGLKTKVGIIIESRADVVNKNKVALFSEKILRHPIICLPENPAPAAASR